MEKKWRGMDALLGDLSDDDDDDASSSEENEVEKKKGVEKEKGADGGEAEKDPVIVLAATLSETDGKRQGGIHNSKEDTSVASVLPKKPKLCYEALAKHGYHSGPSVLLVPEPRAEVKEVEWGKWGKGERREEAGGVMEETLKEREELRLIVNEKAGQAAAEAIAKAEAAQKLRQEIAAERRQLSFNQKEKRKRDMGQASRGKNYVEEEKRQLRDQGVYSGFDA